MRARRLLLAVWSAVPLGAADTAGVAFDAAAALAALAPPAAGHDETTFLRALRERVDRRLAIIDTQPATDPSKEDAFNEFGKTHVTAGEAGMGTIT